jgi:hypothetical protein
MMNVDNNPVLHYDGFWNRHSTMASRIDGGYNYLWIACHLSSAYWG